MKQDILINIFIFRANNLLYTIAKSILRMQNLGNDVSFGMKMVSTAEVCENRSK